MLRRAIPLVLAGCAGLLVGVAVIEPEKAREPEKKAAQKPEWMAMGEPNSNHARLASLAGEWDQTIRIFAEPGKPPMESKGTATYKVILGGRFITEEVKWSMGDAPFEWTGIYGYDNRKNRYIAMWADNLDTSFEEAEGDNGMGGNDISFIGKHIDPSSGEEQKFRWTIKLESQSRVLIEMTEIDGKGAENKTIEIEQKRR